MKRVLNILINFSPVVVVLSIVLLFVGYKPLGASLGLIGSLLFFIKHYRNKPPKNNQNQSTTDYTLTTWYYMENENSGDGDNSSN